MKINWRFSVPKITDIGQARFVNVITSTKAAVVRSSRLVCHSVCVQD